MNFVFGFRVAYRHDGRIEKAGGIESLLAVVIPSIFHCECRPVEHLLGLGKIKAVLFQVGRALCRRPREFDGPYYTYDDMYFKLSAAVSRLDENENIGSESSFSTMRL